MPDYLKTFGSGSRNRTDIFTSQELKNQNFDSARTSAGDIKNRLETWAGLKNQGTGKNQADLNTFIIHVFNKVIDNPAILKNESLPLSDEQTKIKQDFENVLTFLKNNSENDCANKPIFVSIMEDILKTQPQAQDIKDTISALKKAEPGLYPEISITDKVDINKNIYSQIKIDQDETLKLSTLKDNQLRSNILKNINSSIGEIDDQEYMIMTDFLYSSKFKLLNANDQFATLQNAYSLVDRLYVKASEEKTNSVSYIKQASYLENLISFRSNDIGTQRLWEKGSITWKDDKSNNCWQTVGDNNCGLNSLAIGIFKHVADNKKVSEEGKPTIQEILQKQKADFTQEKWLELAQKVNDAFTKKDPQALYDLQKQFQPVLRANLKEALEKHIDRDQLKELFQSALHLKVGILKGSINENILSAEEKRPMDIINGLSGLQNKIDDVAQKLIKKYEEIDSQYKSAEQDEQKSKAIAMADAEVNKEIDNYMDTKDSQKNNKNGFDEYFEYMSKDGAWTGAIELQAVCKYLGFELEIQNRDFKVSQSTYQFNHAKPDYTIEGVKFTQKEIEFLRGKDILPGKKIGDTIEFRYFNDESVDKILPPQSNQDLNVRLKAIMKKVIKKSEFQENQKRLKLSAKNEYGAHWTAITN